MSAPTSYFITAPDGLNLYVREYGPRSATGLPVVCLSGLTRTSSDFDVLASALSANARRRVIAFDYRGRGHSDWDRDPGNYNPAVELSDVMTVLTATEIGPAVIVGTSRGGILTMLLASERPASLVGAVLNDIGPVIEMSGLLRIKSYVGKLPQPGSFQEAAELLRRLFGDQFPRLSPDQWMAFARRAFKEQAGRLIQTYDPGIAETLKNIRADQPPPPLWREFDALASVPVMVIRGANSDVLSPATVKAMLARRSDLEILQVPDQGHTPLLVEDAIVRRVAAFVSRCEASRRR